MATNPAVSLPRAGAVREALKKLELFVVSENVALERHGECRRAHSASRRRLGREGRHGDEFRAAHLAPARRFCRCPARRSPTGGSSRKSRGAWALREAFAYDQRRRYFPRARRAVGVRERRHARFRSRRAGGDRATRPSTRSIRSTWPVREGESAGDTRFFADGGFFTPDRKARFIAPEAPALRGRASDDFPSCSTPAACATSGTP